jgi:hypothetical protein
VEISNDDAINPDSSRYIIENFAQMNGMYSSNGRYHAVFGAVQGILNVYTSTIIDYFPVLYWNSSQQSLTPLTAEFYQTPADTAIIQALSNYRPGNGLGNAYPHLSEGPNGDLLAIWQQWEYDSTAGSIRTVLPVGGSEIFLTDFWGAYSPDGGTTWSEPFYIAGQPGQSEVFPMITSEFLRNAAGDSLILDIMYLLDTNPGVSLLNQSDPSECILYFERVKIAEADIQFPAGVNPRPTPRAAQFFLGQSYPNPFNPVTNIGFRISDFGFIKLSIFDITGRLVRTLVHTKLAPGSYIYQWDGRDETGQQAASGVYIYRLTAGKFSQSRKMLLLR